MKLFSQGASLQKSYKVLGISVQTSRILEMCPNLWVQIKKNKTN